MENLFFQMKMTRNMVLMVKDDCDMIKILI